MRVKKQDAGEELGVQMAPLIDCVFLLLVYFLCTSHVTKQHKDLGIDLPEAASAKETKSAYETLIIEVTRDGTIYVDSQQRAQEANAILHDMQATFNEPLMTRVLPLVEFKSSKPERRNYFEKNTGNQFCKRYIEPKLKKLCDEYTHFIVGSK